MNSKKRIAWGASKLLKMHLERNRDAVKEFAYCIDSNPRTESSFGLSVYGPSILETEAVGSYEIVVFAVSSGALRAISTILSNRGLEYRRDFIYYSDYFYDRFVEKAKRELAFSLNPRLYNASLSLTLNSVTPVQTTVLGTWLWLELVDRTNGLEGAIAEVGAFEGGNAKITLARLASLNRKTFYVFDSFEGFPEISEFDPIALGKGTLNIESPLQEIMNSFRVFEDAKVIKGFVPATFSHVPKDERFSLVFYDCDLYQPALDTYAFFWDKLVPGGFLVIHDHEVERGGYEGVKKATSEFFDAMKIKAVTFYENTMAVLKKE